MNTTSRYCVVMILACLCCSLFVNAQIPELKINDKDDPNVYLSKLNIDVKVTGTIAITTMEMTFRNKNNRILEGELVFPLPEGISVSRYALDMNGHMREAVPVEKEKATEVFEEIERRRIDPGMLEKVEGNNFRTRIYPLPANGTRTVIIAYEEELAFTDKHSLRYHLPLDYTKPLDHFKLDIAVSQAAVKPELEEEPDDNMQFKTWHNSYTASISKDNFTPEQSLTLTIPKSSDQAEVMMQEAGGNYYFLVNCFPKQELRAKVKPDAITIIWDASLSGLHRDTKKELDLLDKYLSHNSNAVVNLTVLNNTFRKVGEFRSQDGAWNELHRTIEQLNYDGGTNYSKIVFPAGDEYLFFTDGLSSLSTEEIKLPNKPVYTISSAARSDFSYLQFIAQKTGGVFINLGALKTAEAEKMLAQQALQFIGIKNNRLVSETYPSMPKPIVNNFSLAGIAAEEKTSITLQFGYGKTVTSEKTIALDFSKHQTDVANVQRVWAQKKIGELDVQYDQNKELITLLGKQFSIVTRSTSLIVLETVNDYVRYEIEPPTELREQYDRMIKQQLVQRDNNVRVTLANALQYFNNLSTWWKMSFTAKGIPPPPPVKRRETIQRADTVEYIARTPNNRTAQRELEEVVVTGYGTQRKQSVTGSVSVQADRNAMEAAPGAAAVLAGRIPGLAVEANKSVTRSNLIDADGSKEFYNDEFKTSGNNNRNNGYTSSIDIKQWTPERVYLQSLGKEKKGNRYQLYLTLRKDYLSTPTFYYDVANFFFQDRDTATGMQILTNMAEIDLENHELYKLLGCKLRETGAYEEAVTVFRKILQWRPQEPQSYRDYGLALADAGQYQNALDTLYAALKKNYSQGTAGLYPGVEEIIVTEMNQLIALHKDRLDVSAIDAKLIHAMPVDVRVVLSWNKNNTDMDLWVTDPNSETCYYSHKQTLIGGRMSNDFTRGYGPEQFMLKKAINGTYKVQINYYGDQQFKFSGPTTVLAEIYTHYSDGRQERKLITLQMEKGGRQEGVLVGEFQFGKG
jgi:tetratricopeptide (TPR) repeat protein